MKLFKTTPENCFKDIINYDYKTYYVSGVLNDGVQGGIDEGTKYSFQVTEDRFALGNTRLINHKTYHFMAVAYGFNPAEININPYDPNSPGYDGKNQPSQTTTAEDIQILVLNIRQYDSTI